MTFSAIVLAGERGPDSPVAQAAGVPCKALAEVADRPMVARVLDSLARTGRISDCRVVGNPDFRFALEPVLKQFQGFACWQNGEASPARSAARAAADIPPERRILLTTADHPLLTGAMIEELLNAPISQDRDITAALVRHADVMADYPGARCTALRFADGPYCGTNLFLFHSAKGRDLMTIWQRVEQARKRPWRVLGLLGPLAVASYLTGLLTLPRALQLLSKRTRLELGTTLLKDPRAALDVDTVGDLAFAREILRADARAQA